MGECVGERETGSRAHDTPGQQSERKNLNKKYKWKRQQQQQQRQSHNNNKTQQSPSNSNMQSALNSYIYVKCNIIKPLANKTETVEESAFRLCARAAERETKKKERDGKSRSKYQNKHDYIWRSCRRCLHMACNIV